jgi:hypothetical protein
MLRLTQLDIKFYDELRLSRRYDTAERFKKWMTKICHSVTICALCAKPREAEHHSIQPLISIDTRYLYTIYPVPLVYTLGT